jgi:2-polyprenyl-3-methyl-5-hydroxy-6-metoxy-1,4-benzoquinol methylase|tara:strand:- start:3306 stop:4160 length:855 start_codon:yes stop_codon:yes gene_type:complete
MANARGKSIDNTHLSIDQAEERGFIHRDYIAHCLRWTHVAKWMGNPKHRKDCKLLDIGCGKDVPLAKMLMTSRMASDGLDYTGIDYNKLEMPKAFENTKFKPTLIGNVAFPDCKLPHEKFDVITSFEVLEHVEPLHAYNMLEGIRDRLAPEGTAFLSTPVYDAHVGAADNHVNEMTYEVMQLMLQKVGLAVDAHYGTFASIKDYKEMIAKDDLDSMFSRLRDYYDSNYLATIFAPLYPQYARNVLWRVKLSKNTEVPSTGKFADLNKPLSSSEAWQPLFDYLGE